MGQRICSLADKDERFRIAGLIESKGHKDISKEYFRAEVVSDMSKGMEKAEVVIDFSTPESSVKALDACRELGKKMVIGTTGFSDRQMEKIRNTAGDIPVLVSPNMSVGVNLLFKIVKLITQSLPEYEKEIVEAHHNRKVDSPSGTANKIAGLIANNKEKIVFGRQGKAGPRTKDEVGVHSVRGGSIVGEHQVLWIGDSDRIELIHRAQSRDIFASGALRAAQWISSQKAGKLYSMEDVLK